MSASLGTGGVSCFDHPQEGWPDSRRTWQLASNTEIPSGLTVAQGGVPHHYIIAPVERVPLNTYTTQLAQIDTTATLVRPDVATTGPLSQTGYSTSKHPSKSVWSVCEALVAVRRGPIVIPDWDANDYALVGAIAAALDAGEVDLDGPTWKGGEETTKVERVAAQAVGAYVQKIRAEFHVQEAAHADDDDWYDGTPMDIFVLCNALGILREGNPLNALVPDVRTVSKIARTTIMTGQVSRTTMTRTGGIRTRKTRARKPRSDAHQARGLAGRARFVGLSGLPMLSSCGARCLLHSTIYHTQCLV